VLDRLGAGDLPARCGAVALDRLVLAAGRRSATLELTGSVALSRERLDTALVEQAVQAGAHFLPGTLASLDPEENGGLRRVLLRQGDAAAAVRARVVLAADGLGGAFLARAGLSAPPASGARVGAGVVLDWDHPFYRAGTVYMACGRVGYVGLVRLEDGRLDLAAALDPAALRAAGGPGPPVAAVLREVGWPPLPAVALPWKGTPPLTRAPRCLAVPRVFALGDAAGYVEPFTGEGMAWALASAEAVAPLAAEGARCWHPGLPAAWARRHREVVGRRLLCRVTAAVLRRPALTRAFVALARVPALATTFVRLLNRPAPGGHSP
jgi:flavin-dependent dehydrogenase